MTDTALDDHTRWVPVTDLHEHPANPKNHSVPELRASMRRLGFMDPLVTDGRTGLLIAGHGRRKALLAMAADGEDPPDGVRQDGDVWLVPVYSGWASADDDEALTALVALNRLTETGGWHAQPLVELLDRLNGLDTEVAGYDDEALAVLRRQLANLTDEPVDAWGEWDRAGMPGYEADDLTGAASVTVHFPSDEDAEAFFALIDRPRRKTIWWPNADGHKGATISKEWTADDA